MTITKDYLHFPASATVEEVLRAYLQRQGQWRWLLITDIDAEYYVCSFGSLLPYLTGQTPHIVHNVGDCPICSSMDPLLWTNTDELVTEALADEAICSRLISDLPMAALPVIEANEIKGSQVEFWLMGQGLRACGLTKNGVLCGVGILVMRGVPGRLPDF